MIKFFRRIRQNMIKENKASKYMLYAIGEILLVMIGILLALQVNNWNENRKAVLNEIATANELYNELDKNLRYTQKKLEQWLFRKTATEDLLDSIKVKEQMLTSESFEVLLAGILGFGDFAPLDSKFGKILSSEQISFSKSDSLIDKMIDLKANYNALKSFYQYNVDTWKDVTQPYLIQNYSLSTMTVYFEDSQSYKSHKKHIKLINDPVFVNIVENIRGDITPFIGLMNKCINQIKELKELIAINYPSVLNQ
ncbi:hypothetical protein JYU05_01205 [bacterium AH-315-P13]|nr:hypothetical protein [bacterium AH-315-P13]